MIRLRTILLYNPLYIVLSLIAVLYSYIMVNYYPYQSKFSDTDNVIEGYIHNYKIDGDKLSILLYSKDKIIVNYYFQDNAEKENFNLKLGDYIKVVGEINEPRSATVFNLFDYKKYLYRNHIFFLFKATKITFVKGNDHLRYTIKHTIINHIDKLNKFSTYVKALVIGDDDGFKDEVSKSYQLNGVSHLFAISGSHISFLAVIILGILKKFKIEENKRYYVVILFLLFYMFLTDYAGSVVRSVVFFAVLAINKMYYFNIKTINVLQLSLFILLLAKPSLLYDVGFQFSFIISLYLIIHQEMINKSGNYIKQTLLISLIAFLASIPICMNNFFQINMLSPIFNVFFVPFVTFIMFPLSFLCLVLPFLDSVLHVSINVLEWLSLALSHIKIGEIILAKPSLIIIILYYCIITFCIRGILIKRYRYFILLGISLLIHCNINYFNNNPYIVFLDVGQGDAIYINLPHNKGNVLIDTGGKLSFEEPWQRKKKGYKIGEDTIIPYLKSIGVRKLDYLILTHGDADHMGESNDIVKGFKVERVILNDGSLVKLERDLIKTLGNLNIPYTFAKANDVININNYVFYVLNPSAQTNENDSSIVLYMNISNCKIMLMGDMSTKRELPLLKAYSNYDVDILKLGHHGSITSTSELFLDALNPQYSVIQVGIKNLFGHPSKIVLDRLKSRKVKVLQTSLNGSIKFILRANDVTIIPAIT